MKVGQIALERLVGYSVPITNRRTIARLSERLIAASKRYAQ
jgi:hypothetical protein